MKYFVLSGLLLLVASAFIWYRVSRSKISDLSFQNSYNVISLENELSNQYGFRCVEISRGECITIEGRSAIQAYLKEWWHRTFNSRTKVFEVNVFQNGAARFSVTAEFGESRVVAIYLMGEPASLAAAESWKRKFGEAYPDAPLDPVIRPLIDDELGKPGTASDVRRRAETIRLP